MSVYNPESVRDVAESLGIPHVAEEVCRTLAQDVEYRIHAIIQEATKFMRHAKRTTLRVSDIDHALRALNVEPVYGFAAHNPIKYREAPIAAGQPPLYYVEDEEIEFEKLMQMPLPKVPREVAYTAHWLAVEGVQPAIPQNPAPQEVATQEETEAATTEVKPLVKHVLSKELLLYFERISKALLDEDNETMRQAALASLRSDPGLHQLLPYIIQFIAEKVTHNLRNLFVLETMMRVAAAVLENANLFVEPYIHGLIPSLLTCIVAKKLGSGTDDHYSLRDLAASILGALCDRFGESFTSLKPRVTKTLLRAFLDNKKPLTTQYGAIRGLTRMGPEVVRVLVLPNTKIYELVLQPELKEGKEEAKKCLEALQEAIETIAEEQVGQVAIPDDVRDVLNERVGVLLTDYVLAKQDDRLVRVLLST
ncbi:transcription initiation factor TFIID subunit 6 [Protomyces lactucae-debilis]|uniref:TBP-associated factor 6 n=1 Tax=Protomyces lactucae-debilis TaxID=2754530 RepID=A0A1Y2EU48_PROLT|nr:transcription initiation factor TFIID subunit 6 [Protomyces lactucae-debilis]ORY75090.1 transcription initiation factor TFIID subunit 6 [Protomyces lactucae-debilis]